MSAAGHNMLNGQLKAVVERIERLEEEKKTIAGDIREVYAEAKGNGFDTKILRKVVAIRRIEPAKREEEASMLDVYMAALGMTPLEEFAAGQGNEDPAFEDGKAGRAPLSDDPTYLSAYYEGQKARVQEAAP